MQKQSWSISIPYSRAEELLKILRKKKIVDNSLEFIRDESCLVIPVHLMEDELRIFTKNHINMKVEIKIRQFLKKKFKPRNLNEAVGEIIPSELHEFIPKAYDVIGNIVVVDINKEIQDFKNEIGKALYELFPSIETVYRKASAVTGELRTRDLELLAGKKQCKTTHVEHSIRIVVDVCKTYFSPRLGHEHKRVSEQIKNNDVVVDLFTGVGPFPLHIAKNKQAQIYAIDINKEALDCLKKSITKNKLIGEIISINDDCRLAAKTLPKADKVIMNLPAKSHEYIDVACQIIKPQGVLFFYQFIQDDGAEEKITEILNNELKKYNWKIKDKLNFKKIRESAPKEIHCCLEVSIQPFST